MASKTVATRARLAEARSWLAEGAVFPASVCAFLTKDEVVADVQRHYEGGWVQFCADFEGVQVSA